MDQTLLQQYIDNYISQVQTVPLSLLTCSCLSFRSKCVISFEFSITTHFLSCIEILVYVCTFVSVCFHLFVRLVWILDILTEMEHKAFSIDTVGLCDYWATREMAAKLSSVLYLLTFFLFFFLVGGTQNQPLNPGNCTRFTGFCSDFFSSGFYPMN